MSIQTVHFRVNGEGLTNLIRQTWAEGRLSVAFDLCEDSGAPPETHIDICTGKKKICGVGDLWLDPDNQTHFGSTDISLESTVERLENRYVKLHNDFSNADLRMRYFTLRCDWAGIKYRNSDKGQVAALAEAKMGRVGYYSSDGPDINTYSSDKIVIERVGKELAEMEPLFSILYPLVGKDFSDIPYHRLSVDDIFEPDIDHPYYLPNLKDNKENIKVYPKKSIEEESQKHTTPAGHLPVYSIPKEDKEIRPIVPEGIDNPYVENAWISRNGEFYGDMRMSIGGVFVHIELANRLSENNIVPDNDGNPESLMEENGWIKLSRNEVLFHPKDDIDYSNEQIETLKKYAKYRKLDDITIGYFGKKIKVKNLDSLTHYR